MTMVLGIKQSGEHSDVFIWSTTLIFLEIRAFPYRYLTEIHVETSNGHNSWQKWRFSVILHWFHISCSRAFICAMNHGLKRYITGDIKITRYTGSRQVCHCQWQTDRRFSSGSHPTFLQSRDPILHTGVLGVIKDKAVRTCWFEFRL